MFQLEFRIKLKINHSYNSNNKLINWNSNIKNS